MPNVIWGYCRISTPSQSIERQERNIRAAYPNAMIIQEAYSGTTMQRPQWQKLFDKAAPGDTIVFDSVSRMSRSAEEGFAAYEALYTRGIHLVFIKEPHISSDTYRRALDAALPRTGTAADYIIDGINAYLLALAKEQIILAFAQAQKEVDDLHQRTREGMLTAKLNGKQIGRAAGVTIVTDKANRTLPIIRKHAKAFGGSLSDAEVIKLCGIDRKTYYKYKSQIKNEEA